MTTQSSDPNLLRGKLCPYLGVDDDRETALSYPSEHNCCYNVKPMKSVNLAQQRQYCLSSMYNKCPIYTSENLTKLPDGWGGRKPIEIKPKPWMLISLAIFLVSAVILVSYWFGAFKKPEVQQLPQIAITPTIFVSDSSPTIEVGIVPIVTETPVPTVTEIPVPATEVIPHMLETVFGNNPQLLIHRIQEGEGFIMLAEKYLTSVDAIKAINHELPATLLYNQIIVVPVNTSDVSNLPPFSIYQDQEGNITIEALADRLKIDAGSFRTYNVLPEGYLISPGEWLLIPH